MKRGIMALLGMVLALGLSLPANGSEMRGSVEVKLDAGELPVTNGAVTMYLVGIPTEGGYRLLLAPSEVTLMDILRCVEDSLHAVACLECTPNRCARAPFCMSLPAWEGLDRVVQEYLSSVTLQQLIDQAAPQPENISEYSCGI